MSQCYLRDLGATFILISEDSFESDKSLHFNSAMNLYFHIKWASAVAVKKNENRIPTRWSSRLPFSLFSTSPDHRAVLMVSLRMPSNSSMKEWMMNLWYLNLNCGHSLVVSGYIIDLSGMALTPIDLLPRESLIHMLKHDVIYSEDLRWIFKNPLQASHKCGGRWEEKGPADKGGSFSGVVNLAALS